MRRRLFLLKRCCCLEENGGHEHPFKGHVLSRVPRESAKADNMKLAAHLRDLVACKLADMEPEQLLDDMRTFS
eukprot:3464418-Karenia_brevis.AAC.1